VRGGGGSQANNRFVWDGRRWREAHVVDGGGDWRGSLPPPLAGAGGLGIVSTGCAALHPWLFSRRPSGTGTCSAADARMEPTLAGGSHGCMPPLHSQNETEWRRGGRRCAPVDLVGHPPGLYPCESPLPPGVFGATLLFSMGWSEGTTVRYIVFRNLEANYLKTENLQWRQRTTLRVKLRDRIRRLWSRQITLMDRLPD
jgi:hypothetical protein